IGVNPAAVKTASVSTCRSGGLVLRWNPHPETEPAMGDSAPFEHDLDTRAQRPATEADRKRFLHEGQRGSALNHPGIAAIYDVFTDGGEAYLVMEYIEGETLRARLTRPIS